MESTDYSEHIRPIRVGDMVKGSVIEVGNEYALIDVGCKTEGLLKLSELQQPVKTGDTFEVIITKRSPDSHRIEVSKKEVQRKRELNLIFDAYRNKKEIEGTIIEQVDKGYRVRLTPEYEGFLPNYLADIKRIQNPKSLMERKLSLYIRKIFVESQEVKIIVSRRDQMLEKLEHKRSQILNTIKIGDITEGVVIEIVAYGAFIDIGGVYALLHTNELSWGRLNRPEHILSLNQKITCKVISLDSLRKRIGVSLKQMCEDPWLTIEEWIHAGDIVEGEITSMNRNGIFVRLAEHISGLIHSGNISWDDKSKNLYKSFQVGQKVRAKILSYSIPERKISLGYKQLQKSPWTLVAEKYYGEKITGRIKERTAQGLVINLPENVEGFLRIKDLSWINGKIALDDFEVNDQIETVVLAADMRYGRVQLGYKQLKESPWKQIRQLKKNGEQIDCQVIRIKDPFVFVECSGGIEGSMHKRYLPNFHGDSLENVMHSVKVGDTIRCIITYVDQERQRVRLSARDISKTEYHEKMEKYMANKSDFEMLTLSGLTKTLKNTENREE